METSYATRGFVGSDLPFILASDNSRSSRASPPSRSLTESTAMAMAIPGNHDRPVPPPLPPPPYPLDRPSYFDNGFDLDDKEDYKTGGHSYRSDHDEGYHSMNSARALHSRSTMRTDHPYNSYDHEMLKKLNARRTLDNRSPTRWLGLSSSAQDRTTTRAHPTQLPEPLSLPVRTRPHLSFLPESPNRYTQTPPLSALSPINNTYSHVPSPSTEYRSTEPDFGRFPLTWARRTPADDLTNSAQGSYDTREDDSDLAMETTSRLHNRLHRLSIEDQARERERGQKRRASSPLGDDIPLASDFFRRRDLNGVPRGSPQPRLPPIPQSSVSSVSSAGRSASSYMSINTASSRTSVGSFEHRSPHGRSPVSPTDAVGYESPFTAPATLETRSSGSSINRSIAAQQRQRQPHPQKQQLRYPIQPFQGGLLKGQDAGTQKGRSSAAAKIPGPYICECCPKKPKKFETHEELSAHEAEKQYECSYCGNRFKNKNEAERHQNSLHVRRHSWSCSALTGYSRAFHDSATRLGEADTCGYCGEEFTRTGRPERPNQGRYPTDQDWEDRIRHLQDVHKFRECNATKKFFRADHFRQHLKHSHAGTSGKWTNMLENACMIEEDPPVIGSR